MISLGVNTLVRHSTPIRFLSFPYRSSLIGTYHHRTLLWCRSSTSFWAHPSSESDRIHKMSSNFYRITWNKKESLKIEQELLPNDGQHLFFRCNRIISTFWAKHSTKCTRSSDAKLLNPPTHWANIQLDCFYLSHWSENAHAFSSIQLLRFRVLFASCAYGESTAGLRSTLYLRLMFSINGHSRTDVQDAIN